MNGPRTLDLIVPCYNEADCLSELHVRLGAALAPLSYQVRFIFVDDGSSDDTLLRLAELRQRDPRIHLIALSRNFGHQAALSCGLAHSTADACITMDADLQHPPEVLPRLLQAWEEGAEVVNTLRSDPGSTPWLKRITSGAFYRLLGLISDTSVLPSASDFRLLDARARAALNSLPEYHRFLRGLASWIGFRQTHVAYEAGARYRGTTKYSVRKMLRLALDAMFSFSIVPIRLATLLGMLMMAGGALYSAYAIYMRVVARTAVSGWTSLLITVILIGGLNLCFSGIIGEYVARIYEQSKHRPLYLVRHSTLTPETRS